MSKNPSSQQCVPYTFSNHSEYADDDIYLAVVGITDGHVWIDCKTGNLHPMEVSDNTLPGPVPNGNKGPGNNGLYANCFSRLSEIPGKTVQIPRIAGCRILISFKSPLFLYFFGHSGSPSGYSAPNLANPADPNHGIRHEMIELTSASNGLWTNTTRVDSFQYPMGLEVWCKDGSYKCVGELLSHREILDRWRTDAPSEFQGCLDEKLGIIKFPTKTGAFQSGGKHSDYLKPYIDPIWERYEIEELAFDSGHAGIWRGKVREGAFVFSRTHDGTGASIARRPLTDEAMEGSGVLASGNELDKVVQAQFCAALNRHCIDLAAPTGTVQDWSDTTRYFTSLPYNWYVKFWHQQDLSHGGRTYAFCYDDVFDQSSTIQSSSPERVNVTIGPLRVSGESQRTEQSATVSPTAISSESCFTNLVWEDNFDGPTLDYSKWECEVNDFGGGNEELQLYRDFPKNVRVENGCLILEAHQENCNESGRESGKRQFSSGRVRSKHRGDWKYGRFEIRAKIPFGRGIWPAIWMLPTDEVYGIWAASGEIDIMEAFGRHPDQILGTLHFGSTWPENKSNGPVHYTLPAGKNYCDDFHVFALEWSATGMKWFVDGECFRESPASEWFSSAAPSPAPFDQRFHLIFNIAVGGAKNPEVDPPDHTTPFPARMEIDWVRVYQ